MGLCRFMFSFRFRFRWGVYVGSGLRSQGVRGYSDLVFRFNVSLNSAIDREQYKYLSLSAGRIPEMTLIRRIVHVQKYASISIIQMRTLSVMSKLCPCFA